MNTPQPDSLEQTATTEQTSRLSWTAPQLDKLRVEDTAAASPTDFVDAGIFS